MLPTRRLATRGGVLVFFCAACAGPTRAPPPAQVTTPRLDADDGDRIDVNDLCPLQDGCASVHPAESGEDGCPRPGAIPTAVGCPTDTRRLTQIARDMGARPSLTRLRIASSVPGCAQAVRDGLERAGVTAARLEIRAAPASRETRWAYFEIAAWDGVTCAPR